MVSKVKWSSYLQTRLGGRCQMVEAPPGNYPPRGLSNGDDLSPGYEMDTKPVAVPAQRYCLHGVTIQLSLVHRSSRLLDLLERFSPGKMGGLNGKILNTSHSYCCNINPYNSAPIDCYAVGFLLQHVPRSLQLCFSSIFSHLFSRL